MRNLFIAAALPLFFGLPAAAADLNTIDCVGQELPVAARQALTASAQELAGGASNRPPKDARGAVSAAAVVCQGRHGWSDDAREASEIYLLTDFGMAALNEAAAKAGISVDALKKAIAELSPADRAALLKQDNAIVDRYTVRMLALGVIVSVEEQGRTAGALTAVLLFREDMRAKFERS